ncbi:MAG: hypothetical protein IKO62_07220 [Bacteroidales bacterium]|nr:hypothetical protein [Bacteroidales bacterium]
MVGRGAGVMCAAAHTLPPRNGALDNKAFRTRFTKWASSIVRYFITSHKLDSAENVAQCIRKHWDIESMHWQLDVIFDEDNCLKRENNPQKVRLISA